MNESAETHRARDVEVTVHLAAAGPVAMAIAMRESNAWCEHVDRVRLAHYEQWSRMAR